MQKELFSNAHLPYFLELQLLNAHRKALSSQFISSGETSLSRLSVFPPAQLIDIHSLFFSFLTFRLLHTIQIKTPFNALKLCLFGCRVPTLLLQSRLSLGFPWALHIFVFFSCLLWVLPFHTELCQSPSFLTPKLFLHQASS